MLCGALLATPVVVVTSCTPLQERVTYNTLATVGDGVDTAMKAYTDLLVAGKVDVSTLKGVAEKYTKFQTMYKAAVIVAQGNPKSTAPPNVTEAAAEFLTAAKTAEKVE